MPRGPNKRRYQDQGAFSQIQGQAVSDIRGPEAADVVAPPIKPSFVGGVIGGMTSGIVSNSGANTASQPASKSNTPAATPASNQSAKTSPAPAPTSAATPASAATGVGQTLGQKVGAGLKTFGTDLWNEAINQIGGRVGVDADVKQNIKDKDYGSAISRSAMNVLKTRAAGGGHRMTQVPVSSGGSIRPEGLPSRRSEEGSPGDSGIPGNPRYGVGRRRRR